MSWNFEIETFRCQVCGKEYLKDAKSEFDVCGYCQAKETVFGEEWRIS